MNIRAVEHIIEAVLVSDGDGVKLKRIMSQPGALMDPFLMIDELKSDQNDALGGGFPPHPHRGIETISYMLAGSFIHNDSLGNRRKITAGGIQWIKAGRGIIHSEHPVSDSNHIHGFQIWLNLPAKNKLDSPEYKDIATEKIKTTSFSNGTYRLLAGQLKIQQQIIKGPIQRAATEPLLMDITLDKNQRFSLGIDHEKTMIYVYQGSVSINSQTIEKGMLAILGKGDTLKINTKGQSRLLILVLRPTPFDTKA